MSALPRVAPAPFLLQVFGAALLLPAVSCTSLKSRLPRAATVPHVGAAIQSVYEKWQQLPAGGSATAAERTQWRASLGGLLGALDHRAPPRTWTGTQSIDGWTVT